VALPNLASTADLSARGVEPDDDDVATTFLAVASSIVRAAAGSPIGQVTSTVTLWALDSGRYLELPGQPVTAVSAVVLDGSTLTAGSDYKLIHGRLWRWCGWGYDRQGFNTEVYPLEVSVTMTHGLPSVPEWVKQLVCDVAIAGISAASGGARDPRVVVESIDDYSVTFSSQGEQVATATELPEATKSALRRAFGGGVAVVVPR
jgi:hypothetical protein